MTSPKAAAMNVQDVMQFEVLKALAEGGSFTASEVAAADPRADERDVGRAVALLTWSGDVATQPERGLRITDQGLARLHASRT